ncbi:hypothetical protein ELQ90_11105 [Labedella phragmitis]|uniref:Uncharacterized protein n=1 Tax=Labedella phragmitis TaxID=2498849 RepID=A0A444PRJ8_9MICO|nr:hypothetical protein [Labedella phragmitis]RWZ49890.1 hypothetical protein ELQ90_11105 [Labedella phragmitis]
METRDGGTRSMAGLPALILLPSVVRRTEGDSLLVSGTVRLVVDGAIDAPAVAWSPRPNGSEERTWAPFRRRVAASQPRLDALGIGYTHAEGIDWS